MASYYEVKPGQIWADNDPRSAGRTLRVGYIEDSGKVVCTVLTNSADAQTAIDGGPNILGYAPKDARGKRTRIGIARFKPTSTGYRLVQDQQYGIRWSADSVFAFNSREDAEAALREDGRGVGVLVVHEIEPGTPNSTEWREVEA
jgi:hypothetical protein